MIGRAWASAGLLVASMVSSAAAGTVLGIDGQRFTLDGQATFLLGASFYGGLGASDEFVRRDLDELKQHGFNWIRVWATWDSFGEDVSAVDADGRTRQPYMERLQRLVAECDRRGMVVDVTLARGHGPENRPVPGRLSDLASHRRAAESLLAELKAYRNWYLDLANERDVGDDRFVPIEEIAQPVDLVRKVDPKRLVTASFGGHDLDENDVRDAVLTAKLDFLCPHRPRTPESPGQTEEQSRQCLELARRVGRVVPVHFQEPFRRGYTGWEPTAADFLTDLRGARAGGAAGWCFHNGSARTRGDGQPRRSFDLRAKRLMEQLDAEERRVIAEAVKN